MMEQRFENIIQYLSETFEEWEEEPAKKFAKGRLIEFSRHIFNEGALYGYSAGLGNQAINIASEMDKRGFINTIKPEDGNNIP